MNYLIIVTGMPGSGKTSIATFLNKHLDNSTFISLDQLKENIYDLIGFHCRKEKTSIRNLSYDVFSMLLEECMNRGDKIIITEYAFDNSWLETFHMLVEKYDYQPITIQVSYEDLSLNYTRMVERDRNSNRHVAQCLKVYNPLKKNTYTSVEKWNFDYFKEFYDSFSFINLGEIVKVQNSSLPINDLLLNVLNSVKSIIVIKE